MTEADQGKFVSDDVVAKADKRHDVIPGRASSREPGISM
jgi:hypothetical protein